MNALFEPGTGNSELEPLCFYEIDPEGRIVFCGPGWDELALQNEVPDLLFYRIAKRPIWEFFSDPVTTDLYRRLIERSHTSGPASFQLRCDSAEEERRLEMTITPLANGHTRFSSRLIEKRQRKSRHNLVSVPKSEGQAVMCSWCSLIRVKDGVWVEVEKAVDKLSIFDRECPIRVSHGICSSCYARFDRSLSTSLI